MEFKIFKDYNDLSAFAAEIVIDQITTKQNTVLGLATGSSPMGLYEYLITAYKASRVDFSNVTTFNLDEYYGLSSEDPQSYHTFMFRELFNKVNINPLNVNIPQGIGQVEHLCVEYDAKLAAYSIDLQILGIGTNGHIAFNEPGTSFETKTHYVKLRDTTIDDNSRLFDNITDVPTHAISMGLKSIMNSRKIILIASGKNKALAINNLINGPISIDNPSSILQNHDDVTILIDEAAASQLNQ